MRPADPDAEPGIAEIALVVHPGNADRGIPLEFMIDIPDDIQLVTRQSSKGILFALLVIQGQPEPTFEALVVLLIDDDAILRIDKTVEIDL